MPRLIRTRITNGLLLGSFLLLPTVTLAQDAPSQVISGRVIDEYTEAPIADAIVTVRDSMGSALDTTTCDADGNFRFDVHPGTYSFAVRSIGFAPTETAKVRVESGQVLKVTITVAVRLVTLEPLLVEGESTPDHRGPLEGFYERVERGRGAFVVREEIELRQPTRITELLYGKPGVRVYGTSNNRTVRIGGAQCPPEMYIDGTRITIGGVDELIHASELEGIEIYRVSETPAEFMSGSAACGVIVLWTTRG